jgi:hypothetical protein
MEREPRTLSFLPLQEQVDQSLGSERLISILSSAFAGVALLLSGIGKDAASRCVCPWIFFSVLFDAPGPMTCREVGTNEMNDGIKHR